MRFDARVYLREGADRAGNRAGGDFLARGRDDEPIEATERWIKRHAGPIEQFRGLVTQARNSGAVTAPMLAQVASQARNLLNR